MNLNIFPIRHHGPGSARSLEHALAQLNPDVVLVEGPSDADSVLPFLAQADMTPPVALLGYVNDDPSRAAFWPFAVFSPEFVALRWAARAGAVARFVDLPAAVVLAGERDAPEDELRDDPLGVLAQAAGFADFERWWESLVEARGDEFDVFAAVNEAMRAVRADALAPVGREAQREAFMRQGIRAALKEGFARVAVVCGAWHAPALDVTAFPVKADAALLKGLPKAKVTLTWVPWTHGRLSVASGYGAGVRSPGYYEHLFTSRGAVAERWFARVARLLRAERLEASSASVIEATRLANALAALRGRALPGLEELNEAALSVFGWDGDLPLRLIEERLVVGEALGAVPDGVPTVPLARDVARQQKSLRLKVLPEKLDLELDLRSDNDLARSVLFHRLNLLGVPWAKPRGSGGLGTFREGWQLRWRPEFSVRLVEASRLGQTVRDAATASALEAARGAGTLAELTALLEVLRLADLPGALPVTLAALDERSALGADVPDVLRALPPLARLARYGDVRGRGPVAARPGGGEAAPLETFRALLTRAAVGLPLAGVGLGDEAAAGVRDAVRGADAAVRLLDAPDVTGEWRAALRRVADREDAHPLLLGDALRRLRDAGVVEAGEVEARLGLALSDPSPLAVTEWLDGFLGDTGALLVHDAGLLALVDGWLSGLDAEVFQSVLPLLRRVFARFEAPERRAIGEALRGGTPASRLAPVAVDGARAARVVPVVLGLLGLLGISHK
ncbi:hypothetical protein GCM10008956_14520 [Deinococcus arenae]|uniref:Uncharacterized protein n=1 Tax=Deinococcus arenae TaxID=1452751 RepID=A0A8H9GNB9_9DEIO|nr:DUF5682 family protein [Deinococcus arenae]AWT36439.1 hypothetical protein DM785_13380 [Deinococcus actinosclerus]GGM39163.1 hypothetical protein GCM10008956_14520 [Deinococcus arenae]